MLLEKTPEAQRKHMAQHVECMCEISYFFREMLPFTTADIAAAAFMHAAERLGILGSCSKLIPSWVLTRDACMAKEVLKRCFAILRQGEADSMEMEGEEDEEQVETISTRAEIPQCAMDVEECCHHWPESLESPTNVDEWANSLQNWGPA